LPGLLASGREPGPPRGRRVSTMRALILYMLGVPVFVIVILWLLGVV
jgi:hypothetical protein